jgi:hypothetical protein
MSGYARALAATAARRQGSGGAAGGAVKAGVERFTGVFAEFTPEAIRARAAEVYAADAFFNDQVKELRGAGEIAPYLARSAEMLASWSIRFDDLVEGDREFYLRWEMTFTLRGAAGKPPVVAPGISHLRFDGDGRVILHQDFWDSTTAIFERVPVLGAAIRAVKRRI